MCRGVQALSHPMLLRSAGALLSVASFVSAVFAEQRDPSLPQVVVIGPPPGSSPMARIDVRRSGRSRTELPIEPRVTWRLRISGLIRDVATGDGGSIAIATTDGRLIEATATGRLRATHRVGAAVLAGPALTSNGARVIVTAEGAALAFSPDGAVLWSRGISSRTGLTAPAPLAEDTGAVVVGLNDRLVRLEQDGEPSAAATLGEAVRSITGEGGSIYAFGESGSVFRWAPPGQPSLLGRYSAAPSGHAALAGGSLIAVVNRQRLESISTESGTRQVLLEAALSDSVAVLASQRDVAVASFDGVLFRDNLASSIVTTVSLPSSQGKAASGATAVLTLTDAFGTIAVASNRGIATLDAKGSAKWLDLSECGEPLAFVPHSAGHLLVACQSGLLVLVGGK